MSTYLRRLPLLAAGLTSLLVLACGSDDLVLPSEGTAAAISITRGNNQTGTVGGALADSLQVRVLDKAGRPVPNQPVAWAVVAGGGSVSPASSNTDANGYAGARWTLGSGAGTQQVRAKPTGNGAPDDLQAVFSATAGASSAASLVKIAGDSQTAVAGSVLPDSLVVRVTDANGNPVADVPVTWSLTGGGAVSSTSQPTGADGRSAVSRTLGAVAGKQTTTATASGLDGSPIEFVSTATVGSAGRLVIARQPSGSAASGAAFGTQPTVQIQDANGNPVALAGIAVQAAMASNPGDGALTGNTTASTNGSGLATFSNLGISGPAGNYTIGFSVPNRSDISGTPPSNTITITAGAATRLRFSVQPSNVATGAAISPAVQVRIEDAQGTLVTGATNSVTIAIGTNTGGATLSGTKTVAASGGVATFSDLSLDRPGTGYTLSASASGLSGAVSSTFNVTTGAATTIAANSLTSLSGTVGSPVSPAPSVKVTDGSGNGVAGVQVTFAVTDGGGSVSGATPTTNSSGIATVGSWTLGPTAGSSNNTLTATASGLSGSPVTFKASGTVGSAGGLKVVQQPSSPSQSGETLAQQPHVQLQDSKGNDLHTAGFAVNVLFATSQPGATLNGSKSVPTDESGIAKFSDLGITGPIGAYSLKFEVPNRSDISPATSATITLTAGSAAAIAALSTTSQSGTAGTPVSAPPSVKVTDASGNPVQGTTVTFAVTAGGGSISGSSTIQTNSSGVATVDGWTLGSAVGTNTLTASAAGLSGSPVTFTATSAAGSADHLEFEQQPTDASAGAAISPPITIRVEDANGNLVLGASDPVQVAVGNNPGGAALSGTTSVVPEDGIATFSDLSLNVAGTGYTLVASSGTLTNATSSAFDVTSGSASILKFSQQPGDVVAGLALSPVVTIRVEDSFGNLVTGYASPVSIALGNNPGAANLTGTTSLNAAGGVASFSDLKLDRASSGYTLVATSGSLTQVESSPFAVTPGPASLLAFDQQPTNVTTGQPITPAVTVRIEDAFGNLVSAATNTVSLALGANPSGATLGGAMPVPASGGIATFSELNVDLPGDGYTLTATASDLSSVDSSPFNVTSVGP